MTTSSERKCVIGEISKFFTYGSSIVNNPYSFHKCVTVEPCYICFTSNDKTYSSKRFYKCKIEHSGSSICKACVQKWDQVCTSGGLITHCPLCTAGSVASTKWKISYPPIRSI